MNIAAHTKFKKDPLQRNAIKKSNTHKIGFPTINTAINTVDKARVVLVLKMQPNEFLNLCCILSHLYLGHCQAFLSYPRQGILRCCKHLQSLAMRLVKGPILLPCEERVRHRKLFSMEKSRTRRDSLNSRESMFKGWSTHIVFKIYYLATTSTICDVQTVCSVAKIVFR